MPIGEWLRASLENRILLHAARPFPDVASVQPLRALAAEMPCWSTVIREAARGKVLSLVSRNLREAVGEGLPPAVAEELRQRAEAIARRNLRHTSELVRLVRTLEGAGIAATAFKGPVLAQVLYGNVAMRQFSDLDVLVSANALPAAMDVLAAEGYRPIASRRALAPTRSPSSLRHFDESNVIHSHPVSNVRVELHWRLLPPSIFPRAADLCDRTAPVRLAGSPVNTLAPDNLLLYLCVHGSKHRWHRLSWIADIAAFVHVHDSFDWDAAWDRAVRLGAETRVAFGLHLAGELLSAPLPAAVRARAMGKQRVVERASRSCSTLQPEPTVPGMRKREELPYHFLLADRMADRVRSSLGYWLLPKFRLLENAPIPRRLYFLAPLLRPWDWVVRGCAFLVTRMRPSREAGDTP